MKFDLNPWINSQAIKILEYAKVDMAMGSEEIFKLLLLPISVDMMGILLHKVIERFDPDVLVAVDPEKAVLAQSAARHSFMQKKITVIFANQENVVEQEEIELVGGTLLDVLGIVQVAFGVDDELRASYLKKTGSCRVIKHGYASLLQDKRCLIVDGIIDCGLGIIQTRQAVAELGGKVIGAVAIFNCNAPEVNAETLGVPKLSLLINL